MSGWPDVRGGSLPSEATSFVGRRGILADARSQLAESRLLTLTGPGGVGKTRLAIELARSVARVYRDGLWFVGLDALAAGSDAETVAEAVDGALQIRAVTRSPVEAVVQAIGANRVLLVFDNCEHVLDAIRPFISVVLARCPGAEALATSREPLNLAGEVVRPVPPLDLAVSPEPDKVSDAVTLFLDRARAIVPNYAPEGDDVQAIVDICDMLEGIPLAIQLAAVRLRILSPRQILDRLQRPLEILTGRSADLPDRQRTLRASIEWSYELCDSQERWLWSRLAVFAGGWDLAEAELVTDPEVIPRVEIVDVLQRLVEKSLVFVNDDGEYWYGMLASIREFGLEMLTAAGGREDALRALRDATIARLYQAEKEWIGPAQDSWLRLYFRAAPTMRTALEFSLSGDDPDRTLELTTIAWRVAWQAVGRVDEHRTWLTRALAASREPTPVRSQALALAALHAGAQGDFERAAAALDEGMRIADLLHDPFLQTVVSGARAEMLPDSEETVNLRRALASLETLRPDLSARFNSKTRLALEYERMGDATDASNTREEILASSDRTGDRYEASYLMLQSGLRAALTGDIAGAIQRTRVALEYKLELTNPVGVAQALEILAFASAAEGRATHDAVLMGAARSFWRIAGVLPATDPAPLAIREGAEREGRAALGDDAFEREYERGRDLTAQDALAVALGSEDTRPAPTSRSSAKSSPLSPRENEVAALVAEGLSDKQIAAALFISQRTAESHVQNSLVKLGLHSRTQLAVWSLENPS